MIGYLCTSLLWSVFWFVLGVAVGGIYFGYLPTPWRHK